MFLTNEFRFAVLDQALVSGTAFVTGIIIARFAGPTVFGECNMIWMIVLLGGGFHHALVSAPMMTLSVKFAATGWSRYSGSLLINNSVFAVGLGVIAYFFAHAADLVFPAAGVGAYAGILAVTMVTTLSQDFLRRYWFTRDRPARAFTVDAIRYVGQLLGLLWLTLNDKLQATPILWMMVIASVASIVVNLRWLKDVRIDHHALRRHSKEHFMFSKWLAGTSITQWFSTQFIIFSAGGVLGPIAVGAIKAAQTLMGATHVVLFAFENIVPKNASKYAREPSRGILEKYLLKSCAVGSGFTLGVAVVLSLAPEFWLTLIYGEAYRDYGRVLQLFALAYVLRSFVFIGQAGLRAIQKTSWIFLAEATTSIVAVSSAWVLINEFGIMGALAGVLIVAVMRFFVVFFLLSKGLRQRQQAIDHPQP